MLAFDSYLRVVHQHHTGTGLISARRSTVEQFFAELFLAIILSIKVSTVHSCQVFQEVRCGMFSALCVLRCTRYTEAVGHEDE